MLNIGFNEVVEVRYLEKQNEELTKSFKDFYKLEKFPKISRTLIVPKESYMKFLRRRIKERTPFEQSTEEIPLQFDEMNLPFDIVETITYFIMPKGELKLREVLDGPCGLTKEVHMTYGNEFVRFDKYFEAELDALKRFLEEIK